jgi:hypothetical protein
MSCKTEFVQASSSSALGPSGHPFGGGLRSMMPARMLPVEKQPLLTAYIIL